MSMDSMHKSSQIKNLNLFFGYDPYAALQHTESIWNALTESHTCPACVYFSRICDNRSIMPPEHPGDSRLSTLHKFEKNEKLQMKKILVRRVIFFSK